MPAYNFKAQFSPLVESGQKRQTIRQTEKGARPGATAYLYTGQRTAQCRKLGEGRITAVMPIEIGRNGCGEPYACLGDYPHESTLVHGDLNNLAQADGFANGEEMAEWFATQYGLPFSGYLHQWVPSNAQLKGAAPHGQQTTLFDMSSADCLLARRVARIDDLAEALAACVASLRGYRREMNDGNACDAEKKAVSLLGSNAQLKGAAPADD